MPQLKLPVSPDGLFVDVLVGLDGRRVASLLAAGQAIPPSIQTRGLIDTGSDVTCVHSSILRQIGASIHSQNSTQTIGGSVPVNIFEVRLSLTDARNPGGPLLLHPVLLIMELPDTPASADVLIGLDILLGCKLVLDGPARQFTLDF